MDLRAFITQALCDIAGGVNDAQSRAEGVQIVPRVSGSFRSVETGISDIQSVEFEVAVSTTENKGREAKLSVVAGLVGGGVQGNSEASSAHAATLRFRVPVRFQQSAQQGTPTEATVAASHRQRRG